MENMRESFEKHIIDVYAPTDEEFRYIIAKVDNPSKDYASSSVHEKWVDWQAAWKARQEFDAKLCDNYGKIRTEQAEHKSPALTSLELKGEGIGCDSCALAIRSND